MSNPSPRLDLAAIVLEARQAVACLAISVPVEAALDALLQRVQELEDIVSDEGVQRMAKAIDDALIQRNEHLQKQVDVLTRELERLQGTYETSHNSRLWAEKRLREVEAEREVWKHALQSLTPFIEGIKKILSPEWTKAWHAATGPTTTLPHVHSSPDAQCDTDCMDTGPTP